MRVAFFKYHGLGNDFVVFDRPGVAIDPAQAVSLCKRHTGIGADGVLVLANSQFAARRMHVINADGSTAEMCGNGIRCAAKYLVDHQGAPLALEIDTGAGRLRCETRRGPDGRVGEVQVNMGRPELGPARTDGTRLIRGRVDVASRPVVGTAVALGNPHFVVFDADVTSLRDLGPVLETHPLFPNRTNVEFARVEGDELAVDVWERGCGITQACGTGACAAAVAAVVEGRLPPGREMPVRLAGGILHVTVAADLSHVLLRGPAVEVFFGEVELP